MAGEGSKIATGCCVVVPLEEAARRELADGRAAQERMCNHPEPLKLRVAGKDKGAQRVAGRAAQAARSVRCAHGSPAPAARQRRENEPCA